MSDQAEPEPHAPFTGDVSHSGLDALKHGEPTCRECGGSPKCEWKVLPNGATICPNCQKNILTGGVKP
jgi:hypothetical protein